MTDVRRGERQDDERLAVGREVDGGAGVEAAVLQLAHAAVRDVDERHVMAELKKALSGGRADHPGPDDDDRGRCGGRPVEDLLHEISSGADAGT